jgi:hypothetical protein
MNRMIRRTAAWALPCGVIAAMLAVGALWLSAGSSTATLIEPANTVGTSTITSAGAARSADSCGFSNPCDSTSALDDSIARVDVAQPPSPNPNACWYCFTDGAETTYTQWFVGIDYANPIAVYKINAASPHEPVARVSGSQAKQILARHGYDLAYASPLVDVSCESTQTCPKRPIPMQLPGGSVFTMSGPPVPGETWEIVPMVAERWYAHTDNSLDHLGETRSAGVQKVVIALEEIVLR